MGYHGISDFDIVTWPRPHGPFGPGELVLLDPDHRVKPQRSKYWVFYEGASLGGGSWKSWQLDGEVLGSQHSDM